MKTIVLPTDFSENSWLAMNYAVTLFGNQPCQYLLLNTYSIPNQSVEGLTGDVYERLKADSLKELNEFKNRFLDLDIHKESKIEVLSEYGYVTSSILTLENQGRADFVVMGTKGISGIGEYFIGTITADVIEKCTIPVVCVPLEAKLEVPKNIAVSLDENGLKYVSAIETIMEIGKSYDSKVKFVYVLDDADNEENREVREADKFVIDSFYDYIDHGYEVIQGKYVEDELMKYINQNKIQMMCMIKHDHGFWSNLFHRSLSKSMAFHINIPLIVLHD